jgi:hypothetical protein
MTSKYFRLFICFILVYVPNSFPLTLALSRVGERGNMMNCPPPAAEGKDEGLTSSRSGGNKEENAH